MLSKMALWYDTKWVSNVTLKSFAVDGRSRAAQEPTSLKRKREVSGWKRQVTVVDKLDDRFASRSRGTSGVSVLRLRIRVATSASCIAALATKMEGVR